MKKLFKPHRPQQQDDFERDRDREGPRAGSPFTVVPNPASLDAQFYAQQQQQLQQHAVQRGDRIHNGRERDGDRPYRNSMLTYPSSDDISSWEIVQNQQSHPYRQQQQQQQQQKQQGVGVVQDRERSASLAGLTGNHTTSPGLGPRALPNPHPYAQPQTQDQYPPYGHPHPHPQTQTTQSTSRTSSLSSLPPSASGPAPLVTSAQAQGQLPPPSAGSYAAPSPTSPAGSGIGGTGIGGVLRKKNQNITSVQGQIQQQQQQPPPQLSPTLQQPTTAAILRSLDSSLMGGMGMGPPQPPPPTQSQNHYYQQQQPKSSLKSAPSIRSNNSREHREREAHQQAHAHLRVPILSSRKSKANSRNGPPDKNANRDKDKGRERNRSRSHSLSDIEFNERVAEDDVDVDSDFDINGPGADARRPSMVSVSAESTNSTSGLTPDPFAERDSLELERQAREARWRERDMEIEGKQSTRKGERGSKGFFERLQLGDGDARKEGSKDKEEKREKDDWRVQWTNVFSTAKSRDKDKDKERAKSKKDGVDPLFPNPRPEISGPIQLLHAPEHALKHTTHTTNLTPTPFALPQHTVQPYMNVPPAASSDQIQVLIGSDAQSQTTDPLARAVGLFVSPGPEGVNWPLALELSELTKGRGKDKKDGREGRDGKEGKEGRDPKEAEANAKSIAKALRKELKYARISEQIGAVTLWAVMLQNASDVFITQTSSRKFLDVVEDIILHSRSALLRDRLIEVLGSAAYLAHEKGGKDASKRENFKSLWRKVKPDALPDEGMPLSSDNPIFLSQPPTLDNKRMRPPMTDRGSPVNGIISPDEDMRRLFQECVIARGNAQVLNEALAFATPKDLKKKDIIKEFHTKCRASKELIYAQIPWADAGAERSRMHQLETLGGDVLRNADELPPTKEQTLLAELLCANEELAEALRIYGDIQRIGDESEAERQVTERSMVDTRGNYVSQEYQLSGESSSFLAAPSIAQSSSRSQSPSSLFINSQPSQASFIPPSSEATMQTFSAGETVPTSASTFQQHFTHVQAPQVSGSDSSHSQQHGVHGHNYSHNHVHHQNQNQDHKPNHLAPAPNRPLHGPRSPAHASGGFNAGGITAGGLSRTSSPIQYSRPSSVAHSRATSVDLASWEVSDANGKIDRDASDQTVVYRTVPTLAAPIQNEVLLPSDRDEPLSNDGKAAMLSEKAAGKRRMVEGTSNLHSAHVGTQGGDAQALHIDHSTPDALHPEFNTGEDTYGNGGWQDDTLGPGHDRWTREVKYAYDAAAERTKERMRLELVT